MNPDRTQRTRSVWPTLGVKIVCRNKWVWIGTLNPAGHHSPWAACYGKLALLPRPETNNSRWPITQPSLGLVHSKAHVNVSGDHSRQLISCHPSCRRLVFVINHTFNTIIEKIIALILTFEFGFIFLTELLLPIQLYKFAENVCYRNRRYWMRRIVRPETWNISVLCNSMTYTCSWGVNWRLWMRFLLATYWVSVSCTVPVQNVALWGTIKTFCNWVWCTTDADIKVRLFFDVITLYICYICQKVP